MANCGLKTDARTLRATDNRTLPSAVSRNTVATDLNILEHFIVMDSVHGQIIYHQDYTSFK